MPGDGGTSISGSQPDRPDSQSRARVEHDCARGGRRKELIEQERVRLVNGATRWAVCCALQGPSLSARVGEMEGSGKDGAFQALDEK